MLRTAFLLALALSSTFSVAADAPPPPAAPNGDASNNASDEGLEPQVTIMRRAESTIEEYRVNGQLYMVKITPDAGEPYYLVDTDGDGSLETTRHSLDANHNIPQWILFRW